MSDAPPVDSEAAYWRAKVAQMDADAIKAQKDAWMYPWLGVVLALIASAPFWAAMAVLFGALKITVTPR